MTICINRSGENTSIPLEVAVDPGGTVFEQRQAMRPASLTITATAKDLAGNSHESNLLVDLRYGN